MPKQVIIEIDPSGDCSIDGHGFIGTECDKYLGEIEKLLGVVRFSNKKAEYDIRQRTRGAQRNKTIR